MFLPGLKNQRVFHFTNGSRALMEAFRFNAEKPTSLLYKRGSDGKLKLVGAMYTMPKRASMEKLDDRVPLSVARWHKHVNWCVPKKGSESRWFEQKDGHPLFGPESPVATKARMREGRRRFPREPVRVDDPRQRVRGHRPGHDLRRRSLGA
jgi:hypothetical protein